jgi:tRNA-specific 2-thiouridylase
MFENVYFPVGAMKKVDLRNMVAERFKGLNVLKKKESMGICFIGKRPMKQFLADYINLTPGR